MAKNITIARLNTLVTANAVQFTKELDKASAVAKSRGTSINNALNAVGAGLSIGAVVAFGKSVVDLGGQITDLASAANLTPRGLQAISASAMQNGVSMEEVAKGSEKMRQGLQDAAANGADPLNKSLRKLGLSAVGLSALSMEEKWQVVASSLVHAKNQQEAMNIASEIFGTKIGPKLRTTLAEIAAAGGIEGMAGANSGMIISDSQLKRLDDFGDSMDRLSLSAKIMSVNLVDGRASFQDLWKSMKAPFTKPEQLGANDIRNAGGFKLGGIGEQSKIWKPTDNVAEKMRLAQEKAWKDEDDKYRIFLKNRAEKLAKMEADPFRQLKIRKEREDAMSKLSEFFMGKTGDMGGLLSDINRSPVAPQSNAPTDSFSRIGLMSTNRAPAAPTQKEQAEHLKKIRDTLEKIREGLAKIGYTSPAAYGN